MILFSPKQRAAAYSRLSPPTHAIVIPSPWWFAVLGLDVGVANIGEPLDLYGPLAVIGGPAAAADNSRDQEVMRDLWRQRGGYGHDVFMQPWSRVKAAGKFLGVCTAHGRMEDAEAAGLWFDGPSAINTAEPVLLGSPLTVTSPYSDGQQVVELTQQDRHAIQDALFTRAAMPN